jgi:hypothetical protein
MLRLVGGVVAGFVAWVAGVSILNLVARYGWADYAAVEKAMAFTVPMMAARLSISGISSLVSGAVAARTGNSRTAALVCGVILLLCFIPIHYMLFSKFPLWYHVTFLLSLPALSVLGGQFVQPRAG